MNEGSRPHLRVLFFSYFFPPMGGAGVQRTLKFARYLPDSGIVSTVICAERPSYVHDDTLLGQIPPDTEVIRMPHTPLPARLLSLQRRWRGSAVDGGGDEPTAAGPRGRTASSVWRDRVLGAWAALQVPDDSAGWARKARREAARRLAQSPIDIVVSSSPPISGHLAAMRAARHARIPWVADFRDLWTGNPGYRAPAWRRSLDQRMERRLLAAASGIVTVSPPLERELARIAGSRVPTVTIPNGYDEADFAGITPTLPEDGIYRIVHAGAFYGHRSPEPFLRGLARWLDENPEARNRLRVRLVGDIGSRFDRVIATFSGQYPGVLERWGYRHHADAVREMVSADALLLVVGGGAAARGTVTGKIFEYLRAGRPILLVGPPESEAARLIRECRAGEILDENNMGSIGEILNRWVLKRAAPEPDPARAARYERRLLTRQFADYLYAVHRRFHSRS